MAKKQMQDKSLDQIEKEVEDQHQKLEVIFNFKWIIFFNDSLRFYAFKTQIHNKISKISIKFE